MGSRGPALFGVAAVGIVAAVGYGVLTSGTDLLNISDECTAEVDGHRVELSQEQAENASLITAISVRRGLPGPSRVDRPRDGVPGVRPLQPRAR